MKPNILLSTLILCLAGATGRAQSSLSIVDALPPYTLTATLLSNGHFSVSTRYTGTSKSLIYREDGGGTRPVNYTSHIHFKVDDVVFQLPYELDPITREAPPEHALVVAGLFRDTVAGLPRVNARLYGRMPEGDTVRFLFSMQPVKRPSGGFIRLSAAVENSARPHSIGVLMLIDTKIGDNDQAPIATSFGYRDRETAFEKSIAPGIPEFWLALEGTPSNPGLTARGNLRATGLIVPDRFIFGNWVDYTAQAIKGLASVLWKDRTASDLPYTDSAVLLLWEEQMMAPGEKRLRASTEIGIVDSLEVQQARCDDGSCSLAVAGSGTCLSVESVAEAPCGQPGYHPYSPDSLQALYLVTNTGTGSIADARMVVTSLPAGLSMADRIGEVIPAVLDPRASGVATLLFYAVPRLAAQSYSVPVALVTGAGDTVMRDEICIVVPGLLGTLSLRDVESQPLCPGGEDTLEISITLGGARCLPITSIELLGNAPDIGYFRLLQPLPTMIPASGTVTVRVVYAPAASAPRHAVRLAVSARDFESLTPGDTTWVTVSDTADVVGLPRDPEFFLARSIDTLDLGRVCVGGTEAGTWPVANIGGCSVDVVSYELVGGRGQFSLAGPTAFPMSIDRGGKRQLPIRFDPVVAGADSALLIIHGPSRPTADTLFVRGIGELPRYSIAQSTRPLDTLCPGDDLTWPVVLENPTACAVPIDTLLLDDARFTVSPSRVTISPGGRVTVMVRASLATTGSFTTRLAVRSAAAGDNEVAVNAVVASRALQSAPSIDFGDVLLGRTARQTVRITSSGTAGTEIGSIRLAGVDAAEYRLIYPAGTTLPLYLAPGAELAIDVDLTPAALEMRRAALLVETTPGKACTALDPITLTGRGIQPVIDVPRRSIDLGRICVGSSIDTVVTIRNLGNATLNVSRAAIEGSSDIELLDALPVRVPADSSRQVRIRLTPHLLGPIEGRMLVESDGTWFTAPDTSIVVTGAGILCGTISVDTVRGSVGTPVDIPVRFQVAPGLALRAEDVADLMNRSGHSSIAFSIAHAPRLFRFRNEQPVQGMIAAPSVTSILSAVSGRIDLSATGSLQPGAVIAVLRGDVLLGDASRTELSLSLGSLADGYSDVVVRNGLLISEYCAFDRRYIDASGVTALLRPSRTPLSSSGSLEIYLRDAGSATLVLFDAAGRAVVTLLDGPVSAGLSSVPLGRRDAGVYTAVLTVSGERVVARIVVVE